MKSENIEVAKDCCCRDPLKDHKTPIDLMKNLTHAAPASMIKSFDVWYIRNSDGEVYLKRHTFGCGEYFELHKMNVQTPDR